MTTRIIKTGSDREALIVFLNTMKLPFTANVTKGLNRSVEQNKLQRMWINEAVDQLQDETAEQKRGYCKLHFGVPILRNENDYFKEKYDRIIRPHSYEAKLEMMMLPLDFPVSRLMTTGQSKRYLDDIYQHFKGLGVALTEPNDKEEL